MTRTMTRLVIATAMLAVGSAASWATTTSCPPTPDFKTVAATQSKISHEQQLGEQAQTLAKPDSLSQKHPDEPVLVAPGGGCPGGCQTFQQFQLYMPVYLTLPFMWL